MEAESLKHALAIGITSGPVVETVTEKLERHVVNYLKNKFDIALQEAANDEEKIRLEILFGAIVKNS